MLHRIHRRTTDAPSVSEECFYVELENVPTAEQQELLAWLVSAPLHTVSETSQFADLDVLEIGPRLSVETPFSSNAVAICASMGVPARRIERSVRYHIDAADKAGRGKRFDEIIAQHLDPMTQEVYPSTLTTFGVGRAPEPVRTVPILARGEAALLEVNQSLGLGMDDWDISYYTKLFQELGRDPDRRRTVSDRQCEFRAQSSLVLPRDTRDRRHRDAGDAHGDRASAVEERPRWQPCRVS
jgi:phosphoribosylformylglycinamidine synthase